MVLWLLFLCPLAESPEESIHFDVITFHPDDLWETDCHGLIQGSIPILPAVFLCVRTKKLKYVRKRSK